MALLFRFVPVSLKTCLTLSSIGLSLLHFSCSPTYLLKNDFKADPLNGLPLKNVPGDPAGDAVEYIPQIETRLKVVNFPQTASNKGLEFNSNPNTLTTQGGYSTTWLNFKGIQTGNFSKAIQYSLIGKFDNFRDGLTIDVTNGSASVFTRLECGQDGSIVARTSFDPSVAAMPICRLQPNTIYLLTVTVNLKDNTCRIGFIGQLTVNDETELSVNKTVPALNNQLANVTGPINPSISFNWQTGMAAGQTRFTLTGVQIKQ